MVIYRTLDLVSVGGKTSLLLGEPNHNMGIEFKSPKPWLGI